MKGNKDDRFAVIMAGGKGTRFWPESTPERPKQLLDLLGIGKTLLRMSFERAARLVPPENVLVVTGSIIADQVREDLPALPQANILVEPMGRNTAPCVGWAAAHIRATHPAGVMAVLPADHHIQDEDTFLAVMNHALDRASGAGTIVTIGIRPTRPETGYGYIEGGESLADGICRAKRFVEKPDRLTAEHYLKDGNFYWNAGIFNFSVQRILDDLARFVPDLSAGLEKIEKAAGSGDPGVESSVVSDVYASIEGDSIDYAVMEKEEPGAIEVIPAQFGWSDLGSWSAIYERLPCDEEGNVARGGARMALHDTRGCLVSTTASHKVVALVGVEDLVVIDTQDAVLVCPRERDQDVKKITQIIKKG